MRHQQNKDHPGYSITEEETCLPEVADWMTRVDAHLVKPLVELISHLGIFCFSVLCEQVNPGLEDEIWKQC